jgi:hypothetical protein
VAVTPDELGPAWQGGRVHLPLITKHNGTVRFFFVFRAVVLGVV